MKTWEDFNCLTAETSAPIISRRRETRSATFLYIRQEEVVSIREPTSDDIRRAQGGDVEAFERIVAYYQTGLYNLAYRLVHNAETARDLCQEILLRVYRNLHMFDVDRPFRPWLYRVATNVCLNAIKSRTLRTLSLQRLQNDESDLPYEPEAKGEDVAAGVERRERAEIVRARVAELAPHYRVVLVLFYLKQLSHEEICEALDLPLGTVKNRLFRARRILREKLEGAIE